MNNPVDQPESSEHRVFMNVILIIDGTAFVLAFPFAMSILWFPEMMIGAYLVCTAIVSGVSTLIYLAIESEKKARASSSMESDIDS